MARKPLQQDALIERAIEFANTELATADDVLHVRLSSYLSETEVLNRAGKIADPEGLLRQAKRAQTELRQFLHEMIEGSDAPELAERIAHAVNSTRLEVRTRELGSKTSLEVGPARWGVASLAPITRWVVYQIFSRDLGQRLRICALDECVRSTERGTRITHACGNVFINWPGGPRPKLFCCARCAGHYRVQINRGWRKRNPIRKSPARKK